MKRTLNSDLKTVYFDYDIDLVVTTIKENILINMGC